MKQLILALLVGFFTSQLVAQDQSDFSFEKIGTVNPSEVEEDWKVKVQCLEAPFPSGNHHKQMLHEIKQRIAQRQVSTDAYSEKTSAVLDKPIMMRNFEGNEWSGGVPNDNDMAINNDGQLISVINSNIYVWDVDMDSLLLEISLEGFTDSTLGLPAHKFDPRVAYDPIEDKFVMVYLSGANSMVNGIVVAFSETSDPTGNWNLYALPGNPFNENTWSDFPMIALTDQEFFLTINLIFDDSTWQAGFKETLIWQMDKFDGYSGQNLDTKMWSNILFGNKSLRNLCPIPGGQTLYGPNIYLISDRNFDTINDTFFIVEVTGTQDDVNTQLVVNYSITDVPYGVPPNARQDQNTFLQTNDGRVLDGVLEDGIIHFVGNTVDPATNFCAIYHGIVSDLGGDFDIEGHIIGDPELDFGYPNISYTGLYNGDRSYIINFNHTSPDSFPGVSAMYYHQFGGYSDRLSVKSGKSIVNLISGNLERWGDYSGSQRVYDEPGKVWISGFWGVRRGSGLNQRRQNATWIAELESPGSPAVGIEEVDAKPASLVFPNPSSDLMHFEFTLERKEYVRAEIYDWNGKLVKILIQDDLKAGLNRMSFNAEYLTPGPYVFVINNRKGALIADRFEVIR